jgi:hypothetical protein
MTTKALVWHGFRLALAALLLWWDVRVFFFYAFTLLLMVLHHVNYVRALVRVLSIGHDAKLMAIYEHLGLTAADVARIDHRTAARLNNQQARSLSEDWLIVGPRQ